MDVKQAIEKWQSEKSYEAFTREDLYEIIQAFVSSVEQGVQSDVCPECSGKKKLFNAAGYPVPCHSCGGSGKRR